MKHHNYTFWTASFQFVGCTLGDDYVYVLQDAYVIFQIKNEALDLRSGIEVG